MKRTRKIQFTDSHILARIMATRDTFPFAEDRAVIDNFLAGPGAPRAMLQGAPVTVSDYIRLDAGKLSFSNRVVAWYDTAGALVAAPLPSTAAFAGYGAHLVHYILDALGITTRITRERDETTQTFRYYFDDQEVHMGAPIVLAGPLTVQAYRASKNQNPTTVVTQTET